MATTVKDAMNTTLSMKDVQRCFEKERRAFLRDLESLRQQLVKKDQNASKSAAVASAHAVQLKKELAALQSALARAESERAANAQQFTHTSALLESALDQHQTDQLTITQLRETLRASETTHRETLALVQKDAAASVRASVEERKALRTRVDELRSRLETERTQWQSVKRPLEAEVAQARARLASLEKELSQSRYREHASHQLKDKMGVDVAQQQRKVTDLSKALEASLAARTELKREHAAVVTAMKHKWRDLLTTLAHTNDQLQMLSEDYSGLYRSRAVLIEQHNELVERVDALRTQHAQALARKDDERWDVEKRLKRANTICSTCRKTPETRRDDEVRALDAVREQTRLAVTQELELARWDRFQALNATYMDVCAQFQQSTAARELAEREVATMRQAHDALVHKQHELTELLAQAESTARALETQRAADAQSLAANKQTMQELMENLSSLTAVTRYSTCIGWRDGQTGDQNKQLQELETSRREETERLAQAIATLEADKTQLERERDDLLEQHARDVAQCELLEREKAKHWNEIVEAQLSANLLIEEQAHTIDDLLQTKSQTLYVSPAASSSARPSAASLVASALSQASSSSMATAGHTTTTPTPKLLTHRRPSSAIDGRAAESAVVALTHECEALRSEVCALRAKLAEYQQQDARHSDDSQRVRELQLALAATESERARLKRKVADQAVTIHELTLQEDSSSDRDDSDGGGSASECDGSIDDDDDGDDEHCDAERFALPRRVEWSAQRRPTAAAANVQTDRTHPRHVRRSTHVASSRDWIPTHEPSAPRFADAPMRYKHLACDVSAIAPPEDEDATHLSGMSFVSST